MLARTLFSLEGSRTTMGAVDEGRSIEDRTSYEGANVFVAFYLHSSLFCRCESLQVVRDLRWADKANTGRVLDAT